MLALIGFINQKRNRITKTKIKKVKNQISQVGGNCENFLLLLTTNPFTIAKSCVPLF